MPHAKGGEGKRQREDKRVKKNSILQTIRLFHFVDHKIHEKVPAGSKYPEHKGCQRDCKMTMSALRPRNGGMAVASSASLGGQNKTLCGVGCVWREYLNVKLTQEAF